VRANGGYSENKESDQSGPYKEEIADCNSDVQRSDIYTLLVKPRQSKVLLWLREHVHAPGADNVVGGCGEDIMRIRGANDADVVNRVGMAKVGARYGRFLDRSISSTQAASSPEVNLTGVIAPDYEVWMKGRKAGGENVCSGVEGIF